MKTVKIVFGIILIIAGLSSLFVGFAMLANDVKSSGGTSVGGKLFFGIGFLGLGIYLLVSATSKATQQNSDDPKQIQ